MVEEGINTVKHLMENWRKFLMNEKLMLKPGPNGWDKYCELVAAAYARAPKFDESAVSSFEAMKPFVDKMFKRIEGVVDVEFVEEHPYLPQYKFDTAVKLKERGYKYYPADLEPKKWLKIGKLHYYHGHHKSGMHHAKAHLQLGANGDLSWAPLQPLGSWFNPTIFKIAGRSITFQAQSSWILMTPIVYLISIYFYKKETATR